MSLRLRELLIRVVTSKGLCGVRMPFKEGLNVLFADNSMGKSTCVQSVVYALGLEGMLTAKHIVPLPHVMTEKIEVGGEQLPVLQSEVLLEISNSKSEVLTVKRTVKGDTDIHLISTWEGPALTEPSGAYKQRDYFVRQPGAASSSVGFHTMFAKFLGWDLPNVTRFDGQESPLYLECLFPLLVIEQKRGWTGIQANMPTQYRIREVEKRSIEFLLNLDVYEILAVRQAIKEHTELVRSRWNELVTECRFLTNIVHGEIQGLSDEPTAEWPPAISPHILVPLDEDWIPLEHIIEQEKTKLNKLEKEIIPVADEVSGETRELLKLTEGALVEKQIFTTRLLEELELERANLAGLDLRFGALEEDLRRFRDARKLNNLGSIQELSHVRGFCPTCHQQLDDALLPPDTVTNSMSIEDNIKFLEEQMKTIKVMGINSMKVISAKERQLSVLNNQIDEIRAKIKALRRTLVTDGRCPSVAVIQEQIRLKEKVVQEERVWDSFQSLVDEMADISEEWKKILERVKKLPKDMLSKNDEVKLAKLEKLFTEQVSEYGLESVRINELSISRDTYKPIHEGFNLQFDLSASDWTRTIWAYIHSLIEVARVCETNHPGLLILDEPRQQSTRADSLRSFLKRASTAINYNQQTIFATSEEEGTLKNLLKDIPHHYIGFSGKILSPLI